VTRAVQRTAAEVQAVQRALAEARRWAANARAEGQRALADAALLDATILRLQAILLGT
jgi:ABC-type nitrate/sulfonate/bicarbonate transport system substrate-binding protein